MKIVNYLFKFNWDGLPKVQLIKKNDCPQEVFGT